MTKRQVDVPELEERGGWPGATARERRNARRAASGLAPIETTEAAAEAEAIATTEAPDAAEKSNDAGEPAGGE